MNRHKRLIIVTLFFLLACVAVLVAFTEKGEIKIIEKQYENVLKEVNGTTNIPRSLHADGSLKAVNIYDWTSGFFAGNLWYIYELTHNEKWIDHAIYWTEILDTIQYWTGNHDIGFMINCSYGNGLRLTGNKDYEQVIVNAAQSLSQRFNSNVGCIKSWDYRKAWDGKTEWYFPVIIDNMMNLELLFKASKLSGNSKFYDIAVTHAKTTAKNHYRDDYSCYHVIDYDSETGAVLDKATCQGFTDESSWARGQAWGLYGFVVCYRETGDRFFLDFAENIASYIMNSPYIPEDKVPYWDYHVNQEGYVPEWDYDPSRCKQIFHDVSSSTITASALLELSTLTENGQKYYDYASEIIESVSKPPYVFTNHETAFFYLKQSVGSVPHGGDVNQPVNYADYYYFESLLRKQKIDGKRN